MFGKKVSDSYTIMTELVMQSHINGSGRLFGGQLMAWMDIAGGICAKRHSNRDAVTARVEKIDFYHAVKANDIVVIRAKLVSVGTTSMRIHIKVEVENYLANLEKNKVCEATFTFVAIDEDGKKQSVPILID
ncbi:MAG: acyl-CoA thioesterase [Clostridia bacterium]